MSRIAYHGISWNKIARLALAYPGISQNDTELSWDITSEALMPYVSFISAPGCLAAAAGLVTPLRTCPVDPGRVAPSLFSDADRPPMRGLTRPSCQPRIDFVHIAPPTAIRGGCVGSSELERAALEVSQLVRYGGSCCLSGTREP